MHKPIVLALSIFMYFLFIGSRPIERKTVHAKFNEIHLLELKLRKEITSQKNSSFKKLTYAVLLARKFYQLNNQLKFEEYSSIAKNTKTDLAKNEIESFLDINNKENLTDADELKILIINKQYEKAFLALPFNHLQNNYQKILYDLLSIKLVKQDPGKIHCHEISKVEIENLNYSGLICQYIIDYLKTGKKDKGNLNYIEENLIKNDLDKLYLLKLLKDI